LFEMTRFLVFLEHVLKSGNLLTTTIIAIVIFGLKSDGGIILGPLYNGQFWTSTFDVLGCLPGILPAASAWGVYARYSLFHEHGKGPWICWLVSGPRLK
jgi:hypothetical protein